MRSQIAPHMAVGWANRPTLSRHERAEKEKAVRTEYWLIVSDGESPASSAEGLEGIISMTRSPCSRHIQPCSSPSNMKRDLRIETTTVH